MIPRNSIGYIPPGNSHYAVGITSSNYENTSFRCKDGTGNIYIYIEKQSNSPEFITKFIFQDSNGSSESSFAKGYYDDCLFKK